MKSGDGQADAGSVKVEWWRAGSAEWPTEAARARWERVKVGYAADLKFYRKMCPGFLLVDASYYWRDWFVEGQGVALAMAIRPEARVQECGGRRLEALMNELHAWDIESKIGGVSLARFLPEIPEGANEVEAECVWEEARVMFEGICKLSFGVHHGAVQGCIWGLEKGREEVCATKERAGEIGRQAALAVLGELPPGLLRGGRQSGAGKGRGKNYPPAVKAAALKFVEEVYGGDLRGVGMDKAYTRFLASPYCKSEIRKYFGNVAAFEKVLEAARRQGDLPSGD